jgi:hypothetical protein
MTIIAFVPNPESASTVVAWAETLRANDEETRWLCLDVRRDGRTTQALIEALGGRSEVEPAPQEITDPAPVQMVLEQVRKTAPRLLLTAPFALPAVEGRAQTSDEPSAPHPASRSQPCSGPQSHPESSASCWC